MSIFTSEASYKVTLAVAALATPTMAFARSNSSSGGSVAAIATGAIVGIGLLVKFMFSNNTTNAAGVTYDHGSSLPEVRGPKYVNVGSNKSVFPTSQMRSVARGNLKQKFGRHVRFVHSGSQHNVWTGKEFVLMYEVPVKCPSCKEGFGVDDFGLVKCPRCSSLLAVNWVDNIKTVDEVDNVVGSEYTVKSKSQPNIEEHDDDDKWLDDLEKEDHVAERFSKL